MSAYGTVSLLSPTIISSPTTKTLKRRSLTSSSSPTSPMARFGTSGGISSSISKYLPPILRPRLSKVPALLVILGGAFVVFWFAEPMLAGFYEDNDTYDPHLYDWHRYPDIAGGSHGKQPASTSHSDSGLSTHMEEPPVGPYGSGEVEYYPKEGLLRGFELVYPKRLTKKGKRSKKSGAGGGEGKRTRHPIEVLMAQGEENWKHLLGRQSKSLDQAVVEYVRRYGRLPPKGFDGWWKFCVEHGVTIVDDYDQINHDIEPYYALSPDMFNLRTAELDTAAFTYHINAGPEAEAVTTGARATATRAKQLTGLVSSIAHLLPEQFTMHVSDHDLGSWILGDDQRDLAMTRIGGAKREDGTGLNGIKHLSENDLKRLENRNRNGHKGWFSACPEDSPARGRTRELQNRVREIDGLPPLPEPPRPAFLQDVRPSFDFCENPRLQKLHGTMSFDFPRETVLRPIFVLSKFARNNEFLFPPLEAYENATSAAGRKHHVDWSEKTNNKLFWRGTSTGDSYSKRKSDPEYNWRRSHRPRLHLMANAIEGESEVWLKRGREWEPETWPNAKLNEAYFDISLTGNPHQCNKEDGTCEEMAAEINFSDRVSPENAALYKYALDVDGNGWSSRFHRLLMSGSVVVKNTIFPEWNQDHLVPWVHYIPFQTDYSDLYDIMAFFRGSPETGGRDGHDDLAKKIAEAGQKFGAEHYRWEDIQAYMYRLLLEYTRLGKEDRDGWSYLPEGMTITRELLAERGEANAAIGGQARSHRDP